MSYIDVRIPYEPNKNLGLAYNRAFETVDDWILFLDHDVFLLNPNWYHISQEAIKQVGHNAGFITCVTNRIGNPNQRVPAYATGACGDDITAHSQYARQLYEKHGNNIRDITEISKIWKLSGFFILTHKQAWKDAGGFADGFLGIDNIYGDAIINAGYSVYLIEGLYCYHRYWRDWKTETCI